MEYKNALVAICALFLCANFGFQTNTSSSELPPLDFYGTLTARNNEVFSFRYLTISGLYKAIPWLAVTTSPEENPYNNTTRLDLKQIYQITVHHEQAPIKYKHKTFIPVSLILVNENEPHTFLVETNRKIICKQISQSGQELTKEITFDAINEIKILGHQSSQDSQGKHQGSSMPHQEQNVTEIQKTVHFISE